MNRLSKKLSENILDKFSMDFLRNQVLKNAYGNDDTIIAGLDPRILLAWYLFFGLVPWFVNDIPFLICLLYTSSGLPWIRRCCFWTSPPPTWTLLPAGRSWRY